MKLSLSICKKLFLSIFILLVLSYSILLIATVKSIGSFVEEAINKELTDHLGSARTQYFARGEIIKQTLLLPATGPFVSHRMEQRDTVWLKAALGRWRAVLPFVDILTIVDAEKKVIARHNSTTTGDLFAMTGILDKAFLEKKAVISTELVPHSLLVQEGMEALPVPEKNGDAMMLTVVIPVISEKGTIIGAIVGGDIINKDAHLPYIIRDIFGKESELSIHQGTTTIASSFRDRIEPQSLLTRDILERLQKGIPYWGKTTFRGSSYRSVFEPIFSSRGEWLGSFAISMPEGEYEKVQWESERNVLLSALLGIALSFLIAYLVARRMTGPLKTLAMGVEKIEMGDLTHRVHLATHDEYGILADSINRMARALAERDSTIRKKTEALQELNELLESRVAERTVELRMEMGRLEAILTNMAEGIIVTDSDNRIILFNPAAQKILDIVPHRLLEQPIEQISEKGNCIELIDQLRELRRHDTRFSGGLDLTVTEKKIKANFSLIHDESGGFAGVVISLRDVTLEEEVDRMKTDFISTVSHELKTPLTSIKGSLQFIMNKGKWLTETERELLSVCLRNTERLIRLINDILDISKIEAGHMEFKMKPQSIGELVVYSIEEIKSFAMSRNISIVNCVGDDLPLVYGDHDRLVQVITNLLSNSVKFSPPDKVVMVSAAKTGNYVAVSVVDHGKTILWSDRERLFKKFQQLDSAEASERGGTGLGLAICKEIVERQYGKIYYEEGSSGGNIFTFTIPIYEERL